MYAFRRSLRLAFGDGIAPAADPLALGIGDAFDKPAPADRQALRKAAQAGRAARRACVDASLFVTDSGNGQILLAKVPVAGRPMFSHKEIA